MREKFFSVQLPLGAPIPLYKSVWERGTFAETLSIVGGLHGDHLNAIYLVSCLSRFLQEVEAGLQPGYRISGRIQLFPIVNAQAAQDGERLWSFDNLDYDLAFPGAGEGEPADRLCNVLCKHTAESEYALLLESAEKHYESFPHIKLLRPNRATRKLAQFLAGQAPGSDTLDSDRPRHGMSAERARLSVSGATPAGQASGGGTFDLGVVRELKPSSTLQLRLFNQWVENGVGALMLSGGKAGSVDRAMCDALFSNIVNFMLAVGVLDHSERKAEKREVDFYGPEGELSVVSSHAGLFLPKARVGETLVQGQKIGEIRDIYGGDILEAIVAPRDGFLVSLRVNPMVYEREPLAVLLTEKKRRWFWPFF